MKPMLLGPGRGRGQEGPGTGGAGDRRAGDRRVKGQAGLDIPTLDNGVWD